MKNAFQQVQDYTALKRLLDPTALVAATCIFSQLEISTAVVATHCKAANSNRCLRGSLTLHYILQSYP